MIEPKAIAGALIGTAVADAVGLACEGLSSRRLARLFPGEMGPRLLFGRGMLSDDGEHACMTAQSLVVSGGQPAIFGRELAMRLRYWLLALPAGTGLATGRAILKLWLGFPCHLSGVQSAGNGPAMRAAVIGAAFPDDPQKIRALVAVSTRITHRDPRAEWGAFAVALAAAFAASAHPPSPPRYVAELTELLANDPGSDALLVLVRQALEAWHQGQSAASFADHLGLSRGVGGYILHTVPVVLHVWFQFPESYREAITTIIRLGGDTDTTAAILGGIVGARTGVDGIPQSWRDRLIDWPRTLPWMERLANRLANTVASGQPGSALFLPVWFIPLRNLFFLVVVLWHGIRRLFPPY